LATLVVLGSSKSNISIGKVCLQKYWHYRATKMPAILALATMGNATQTEIILFVLHHPKWTRKEGVA
jgi:hypothetical protein